MDSSQLKMKVKKSTVGWTPLTDSKLSPSQLGDSVRRFVGLVGEGLLLSTYKQPSPLGNFILADIPTKSLLHTNKAKAELLFVKVLYPVVLSIHKKDEAKVELIYLNLLQKYEKKVTLKVSAKDILTYLVPNEEVLLFVCTTYFLTIDLKGEKDSSDKFGVKFIQTKNHIHDIDKMPTKIADHVESTLIDDELLLCHQKDLSLWNIVTGKCIMTKEFDKKVISAKFHSQFILGTTMDCIFSLTRQGVLTSTPSHCICSSFFNLADETIIFGCVSGTLTSFDFNTGKVLCCFNKSSDDTADAMNALLRGGGVYSLTRKGNLVFAGMKSGINVWYYGKKNQRSPVKVIDTKELLVNQLSISGNKLFALCGKDEKEILTLDIDSQIVSLFTISEPSWEEFTTWQYFLPEHISYSLQLKRNVCDKIKAETATALRLVSFEDGTSSSQSQASKSHTATTSAKSTSGASKVSSGSQLAIVTSSAGLSQSLLSVKDASGSEMADTISERLPALLSADGGFLWTACQAQLSVGKRSASITIYSDAKKVEYELVYSFKYETGLLTSRQKELDFPTVRLLKLVTRKEILDLRPDDDKDLEGTPSFVDPWAENLDSFWRKKNPTFYSREENLQLILQLQRTSIFEIQLCAEFFNYMVAGKINKSKKLHTSKVILQRKEKYFQISVTEAGQVAVSEELYGEIYNDVLIFFRYRNSDPNEKKRNNREMSYIIPIRLSVILGVSKKTISIGTSHFIYEIIFTHDLGKAEWTKFLSHIYGINEKTKMNNSTGDDSSTSPLLATPTVTSQVDALTGQPADLEDALVLNGAAPTKYFYSQPILKKCSLYHLAKKKKINITTASTTIGRSNDNTIVLDTDVSVSRFHAKILIENNVPYIFDVGSAGGTRLNDKNVRKSQLKPGDIVSVGEQAFEFRVKNGKDIFFEQH